MRNAKPMIPRLELLLAGLLLALTLPTTAGAQDAETVPVIEVERLALELRDRIERPPEEDPDLADTALVFTNVMNRDALVRCRAFDGDGDVIGRARLRVPPRGVRWLLASDLSQGEDFIGSTHCFVTTRVRGTAVFIGPGLTDLPAGPNPDLVSELRGHRLAFPLVAHY